MRDFNPGILVQDRPNSLIRSFAFPQFNDGFPDFVQHPIFFRRRRGVIIDGFGQAAFRLWRYDGCIHNIMAVDFRLTLSLLRLPLALARRTASYCKHHLQVTLPTTHFALPIAQDLAPDGLACRHVDDEGAIQFGKCGVLFP